MLGTYEEVKHQVEQSEGEEPATVDPLPEHLQDLVQRSTTSFSEQEAERMRCLLTQYGDVLSRGDLNLDHTALVKHCINTG